MPPVNALSQERLKGREPVNQKLMVTHFHKSASNVESHESKIDGNALPLGSLKGGKAVNQKLMVTHFHKWASKAERR